MDSTLLKQLYFSMLRIRRIEEKIVELYPEQEMRCPVHLSIGQEGVSAGVSAALNPTDAIFSGHRAHGHYFASGGDLKAFWAELYGKATGCCGGKGGSMHLVDLNAGCIASTPIGASTIPIAVGAAFAAKMQGLKRVVVTFFGEGAAEEGVFHESVNFAVLQQLPIIFLCENNLYSVYTPLTERQPEGRKLYKLAQGYGLPSFEGEGNQVESVYNLTNQAVARARNGQGPTFLEFSTYRWREHCGPNYDNHIGYRTEAEFLAWQARCPLNRTQNQLLEQGALTPEEMDKMEQAIAIDIQNAVSFAQSSPFPRPETMFEHIYA